ncbi:PASTA domain-containing protein [bacterium 210820-DFI.6.37]|nr:PASTA domain-containing protein [bacterium 210820-DFI.6.37]
MTKPLNKSKKRIIIVFACMYAACMVLCFRVGWIQIVRGAEYSKMATEQQTRDVPIAAKRGVIYDTNEKELAVSATCYSVWARPASIRSGKTEAEKDANVEKTAKTLSEILEKDEAEIKELITKEQALVKVDKYLDKDTADKIRKKELTGIEIAEDVKRYYPLGAFLAHTLGSVTDDNTGLSGLELQYNQYLSGVSGRWIKNTDITGNGLAYGDETYYQAEDGLGLVLTIDETIQHYVEKSIKTVQKNTKADRVMAIMMDPKTGDILALAQTPEFDPNDSKTPLSESEQKKLESMSDSEKMEYWNSMWRNSLISDVYEPGSTFKLLTTSMALEEGETNIDETFTCTGSINVSGTTLKCWRYYNPHGTQTLEEAVGNSCNPVFVKLAQRIGINKFYNYLETFGISEKTGIDFPGEGTSILQNKSTAGPVGLATMGYGQGVAVTPIQLITAISSLGNDGKLMQPRLVKALVDENGDTVKEFDTKVVRQTVSEKTADEMCDIMEYVVDKGGAGTAKVEGYRVGGKTGTANKAKNGGYSEQTYSSFIGMAPMDDPQVAVLVIVDNPKGVKFGSQTAAPGAKLILEDTLRYLDLQPKLTKEQQKELNADQVTVPDLTGEGLEEAIGILGGLSLNYEASGGTQDEDFIIGDQYPKAGEKIDKEGTVYLYRK